MNRIRGLTCVALCSLVFFAMPACETVKGVFKDDGTKNPNHVATIQEYDPTTKANIPITIEISGSATEEVRLAVKDIQNKDFGKALDKVNIAVEKNPKDAKAWWIKGLLHEYKGEWETAVDAFKQSNILKSSAEAQAGRERSQAKKSMS